MIKIQLPSYLKMEFGKDYFEAGISKISELKYENISSKLQKYLFDDNHKLKKNVRFILNDELLDIDDYDKELNDNDKVSFLIQFIGG